MPDMVKYLIDAAVGAALFFALLFVFVIDWAFFSSSGPGKNTLPGVKEYGGKKQTTKKLKLGVTPSGKTPKAGGIGEDLWDDMGKLLHLLGEGFKHEVLTEDKIIDMHQQGKLNEYDVIFLTCSGGILPAAQLKEPLLAYVANGGILYASDWRYDTVAAAFPDLVVPNLRQDGASQELEADIVDADLREALGRKTIHLKFDLPEWKPAAFGGPRVDVLLKGRFKKYKAAANDPLIEAPLMVKFKMDKGIVIFTSFHNEKQNSRDEEALLKYLVFRLVTAGVDAEINSSLGKEGFTPQRSNLLSAPGKQKIEKKYDNANVTTLRFALGFRNEGVKLRFNITSPDGLQHTKDCESTTVLEVANAAKGTWTYSVEALDAYANFPFTLTVGEKK
jgi:hypothetical protein